MDIKRGKEAAGLLREARRKRKEKEAGYREDSERGGRGSK